MEKVVFGFSDLPGFEIGNRSLPGVIVIQEWWGVTQNIIEMAEQIHAAGFRCLIPDLYKGKIGTDAEEASHVGVLAGVTADTTTLMSNLNFKEAASELSQAADYLRATGSAKVGCTGFCMGGALALAAMADGASIDAGAPFYGIPDGRYFDVTKIKAPICAQFGDLDKHKGFADPGAAQELVEKLKVAGNPIEFYTYASAGHGFMNTLTSVGPELLAKAGNPTPDFAEAKLAFTRLVDFLTKHLK